MNNDIEIRIPHSELVDDMSTPNGRTITDVNIDYFKKHGLNFKDCNDARISDDYSKRERCVKVKAIKKSFVIKEVPWHKN